MRPDDHRELLAAAALDAWYRTTEAKRRSRKAADKVADAAVVVAEALSAGSKVMLCGNGGSAADAQHIAAELTGRYVTDRPPMAAVALTTDTSALTAIANDYGYDHVFSRQVRALGRAGDVLIGISTSGNSPSVVAALEAAREIGLRTIAMTGGRPSRCAELAELTLAAPATETARVQECHIFFGHLLCELLEVTPDAVRPHRTKAFERCGEPLLDLRRDWQDAGLRVVLTNGIFDLLHAGHLESLVSARALGDVLVVGVNTDDTARRLKGPGRPVHTQLDRLRMVAALETVDAAVLFAEDTAATLVEQLRPEVWCKGGDYASAAFESLPEVLALRAYGGEPVILPFLEGHSTSSTIARVRQDQASVG
jgi:phosphoheptose isomerase